MSSALDKFSFVHLSIIVLYFALSVGKTVFPFSFVKSSRVFLVSPESVRLVVSNVSSVVSIWELEDVLYLLYVLSVI
jgi:hypothetical protein